MLRGPSARLGVGGYIFSGRGFLLAAAWAGGPWGRVLWSRGAVGSGALGRDSEARGVADRLCPGMGRMAFWCPGLFSVLGVTTLVSRTTEGFLSGCQRA